MEERREIHTGDGRILKQVESRFYNHRYPSAEYVIVDPESGTFYFDHDCYVLNPEDSKGSLSFYKEGGESLCPGIWDEEDKIYVTDTPGLWMKEEK